MKTARRTHFGHSNEKQNEILERHSRVALGPNIFFFWEQTSAGRRISK